MARGAQAAAAGSARARSGGWWRAAGGGFALTRAAGEELTIEQQLSSLAADIGKSRQETPAWMQQLRRGAALLR